MIRFAFGNEPIWLTSFFADAFYDGILETNERQPPTTKSLIGPLSVVTQSFERVVKSFNLTGFNDDDRVKIQRILSRVSEATELAIRCPQQPTTIETLYEFLSDFRDRVRNLAAGDLMIFPGGWCRQRDKEEKKESDSTDPRSKLPLPSHSQFSTFTSCLGLEMTTTDMWCCAFSRTQALRFA